MKTADQAFLVQVISNAQKFQVFEGRKLCPVLLPTASEISKLSQGVGAEISAASVSSYHSPDISQPGINPAIVTVLPKVPEQQKRNPVPCMEAPGKDWESH